MIRSFFIRAVLWLLPLLALWYVARDYVVKAPAWLAEVAITSYFPFWALGTELQGSTQVLVTNLAVRVPGGRVGDLVPEAHVLTYLYGMPLLVALLLAVRAKGLWWKIPLGLAALLPFQAWSICFTWLLQVAIEADSDTRVRTYFDAFDRNAIGACYQLGCLVLPPLIPIFVWLALDQKLIKNVLLEGAWTAMESDAAT
jgi:hypothetical protein